MIVKRIISFFMTSSSREIENYVDNEMFKEGKIFSDYIGMLARTLFCGVSSAYLYEIWIKDSDNYILLACSGLFMVLGIIMYVYFLDTTAVGLKKVLADSMPDTPIFHKISTFLIIMIHALIVYALFNGIKELIGKLK